MPEAAQNKNSECLKLWQAVEAHVFEPGYGLHVPQTYSRFDTRGKLLFSSNTYT
jgi:hypothetical protein